MVMQATTVKVNRKMLSAGLILLLGLGSLAGCGASAARSAPSAPASGASHASAGCEESCRALHRLSAPNDGQCDEETRALAREGVMVTCVSAPAKAASGQ